MRGIAIIDHRCAAWDSLLLLAFYGPINSLKRMVSNMKEMSAFTVFYLFALLISVVQLGLANPSPKTCILRPLGSGKDDTNQVEVAIAKCGHFGTTVFEHGTFNITRKMTWNLVSSRVDLHGSLSFQPNIEFWLNSNNTYRVVFIQSQASWFVITGNNFVIDAHNTGGIDANGQLWWEFFTTHPKHDGDGRPIALTLFKVKHGVVRNFRLLSPPFWANAVAESSQVLYDGMYVNATNTNSTFFGRNIVGNTDGIDTFRSDHISLINWDVTSGDDCIAIKGNSTNILASDITCRNGSGVAIGSLGQYVDMPDYVSNVAFENLHLIGTGNGVYFKSWDGTVNGSPPTGGGGGTGIVKDVFAKNVLLDDVALPVRVFQTKNAQEGDQPSTLTFGDLHFSNWKGNSSTNILVAFQCSSAARCDDISFSKFEVDGPTGQAPIFFCQNVDRLSGLSACNDTITA